MNLLLEISFEDLEGPYSAHVSFFWWWRPSKILDHDQFSFHSGWGPILGMFFLYEYLELYLPCSYILEDIFLTMHPIILLHAPTLLKTSKEDLSNEVDLVIVEIRRIFLLLLLVLFYFLSHMSFFPFSLFVVVLIKFRTIPFVVPIFLTSKTLDFGHVIVVCSSWTKFAKLFPFSWPW